MLRPIHQEDEDPRESARSNVFLAAAIASAGRTLPVRLRNISVQGALIEGDSLPANGAAVRLSRGHLEARGEIAWQNGDYRGLRFDSPVEVQAWVKKVGHAGQHEVDEKLAVLRDRRRGCQSALESVDRASVDKLSEISVDLDRLCEQLAASSRLPVEVGEQLIRLDTIAQRLRNFAALVGPT